jgi:hypothetical protein
MVDSSSGIVLLGSKKNVVGSTGKGGCSYRRLISVRAWVVASVCIMSLLSIVVAPLISWRWVLGSLGPLNTLISGSRGPEIVGALNHLALWGRKSLSN